MIKIQILLYFQVRLPQMMENIVDSLIINDTYCYQIDLIVPRCETDFSELNDLINCYKYFLISQIGLNELISDKFIDLFSEYEIYLHSYDTQLDSHDCVSLLPNGNLVLSLTQPTYEKIPIQHKSKSPKSLGYLKYEVELSIPDLKKNEKKLTILRNIFKSIPKFSFFCHIRHSKPSETEFNPKEFLSNYFGSERVTDCVNRIQRISKKCSKSISSELNETLAMNKQDNWFRFEEIVAWAIGILPEEFIDDKNEPQNETISLIRIKGFFPNKTLNHLFDHFIKPFFESNENETKRLYLKLHGFRDSPVCLLKRPDNNPLLNFKKPRINEENFIGIAIEKPKKLDCIFYDYDNLYYIN